MEKTTATVIRGLIIVPAFLSTFLSLGETATIQVDCSSKAIKRAKAYEDAGADIVSIALTWTRKDRMRERTLSALKKIRDTIKGPINMMFMDETIKAGNITFSEVTELGYTMGSGNPLRYTVAKAVTDMLIVLKNEGSTN